MGILSGILLFKNIDADLNGHIGAMLSSQKHRDDSAPLIVSENSYAFAGANSLNLIFEASKKRKAPILSDISYESIYAFVDGIVLETPMHRKRFEQMGFKMPVCSCSAIIAAAYKKWGIDFMRHLEGEFSCAIWDSRKKILILVRDPYGHKPLHYYIDREQFVFSSEIKGILGAGVKKEVDMLSLSDFLSLNGIPYPATIFKGIKQVSPGHMLVVENNNAQEIKFWEPKFDINNDLTLDEAAAFVENRLRLAVKKRMVSDNTYCFLSGGIDSSAIVSFAAELSDKPIHAVTVGFKEEERNELEYAKAMAEHVGAKHHYVVAQPDSFLDMLDKLIFYHDMPFVDTSAYPTYYAGQLANGLTDVILTGDGPDQTMSGSDHYVFAAKNNIFAKRNILSRLLSKTGADILGLCAGIPSSSAIYKTRRYLYRNSLSGVEAAYELRSGISNLVKEYICSQELLKIHKENNPYRHPIGWFDKVEGIDNINKYLYADMRYYVPDDLMIKVDRMCMAHGLETLSPFQDIELAKTVNSIPGRFKLFSKSNGGFETKYILKKICEERFPAKVLNKRKQGFGIPLEKWLRWENGKYLKEILLDRRSLNRGYFKKPAIIKFVNDFIENKGDYFYPNSNGMFSLLSLELWFRKYID